MTDDDMSEDEFDDAMAQAEPAELINQPNITVFADGTVMQGVPTGGSGVNHVTVSHQWPLSQPFVTTANAATALRHANQPQEPAEPVTTPKPAATDTDTPTPQKNPTQ